MFNLSNLKEAAAIKFGRQRLVLQKNAPEIMLVLGISGMIASTVMACKATLEVEEILDEHDFILDKMEMTRAAVPETYSEDAMLRDKVRLTAKTAVKLGRLYAPAVITGTVSIGLLVGSNRILNKRNAAIAGAYALVDEGFKQYRQRVVDELGPEKDAEFRFGYKGKELDKQAKKDEKEGVDPEDAIRIEESIYARVFSKETSIYWQRDHETNQFFLKSQQNYANDLLRRQGHVFLNEVHDMLGLERTKAGAYVGWIYEPDRGDGFIDFDIFSDVNKVRRGYVEGVKDRPVMLDFNVDGVILDLLFR